MASRSMAGSPAGACPYPLLHELNQIAFSSMSAVSTECGTPISVKMPLRDALLLPKMTCTPAVERAST